MAGNKGFGAKVRLAVDKSVESKNSFQDEINKFSSQCRVNVKLDPDEESIKNLASRIQDSLDKNHFKIKIQEFDLSIARDKLRHDLKDIFGSSLSEVTSDVGRQLGLLKEFKKETRDLYNKTSKIDPNNSDLLGITQRYQALITQIDNARKNADVSNFDSIQRETVALQENINALYRKIAAEKESGRQQRKNNDTEIASVQKITSLYKQLKSYLQSNTKLKDGELNTLNLLLKQIESGAKLTNGELKQMQELFLKIQRTVLSENRGGKSLFTSISDAFKRFGGWSMVTRTATAIYRAFTKIIPTIKELDTAMTELRKVSVASDKTYEEFFKNATVRAKEYGATVTDIISATADFARLGYSLNEASILADAAIVYKNVGDGIENIEVASQSIISTMKAFDIKVEDSMFLVDKFNAVGGISCPAA